MPLPPHLDLKPHERVAEAGTITEADLATEPGYWVDLIPRDGGTEVVTRKQLGADGREPPKSNKKAGLYARGQPKHVTKLKPMHEIEALKPIAELEKLAPLTTPAPAKKK